jgi:hypothetical protein
MVFAEFRRDDQVAVMIPAREGRGEPTVVEVSEAAITWKGADGALERLGTPAAPVAKDVIAALSSAEGLLVMLADIDTDELVGDFVLKTEPMASGVAR